MTAPPSLPERVAALLAHLDTLAALHNSDAEQRWGDRSQFELAAVKSWPAVRTLINDLLAAVKRAEADANRLRPYARHLDRCGWVTRETNLCNCGYLEARRLHDEAVAER